MADYKASKEAFVSGMTGSSITHINIVSAVALVCHPPLLARKYPPELSDQTIPLVLYRPILSPEIPLTPFKVSGIPCRMVAAGSTPASLDDALCKLPRDALVYFTLSNCTVDANTSP